MTSPIANDATHPSDRAQRAVFITIAILSFAPSAFQFAEPNCVAPPIAEYKINPNTASRAELMLLPGIGPGLADLILAQRASNGRDGFASIEALDAVPRIGPKTMEKLRPHLSTGESRPDAE